MPRSRRAVYPRIDAVAIWEGVLHRNGEYLYFRPLDGELSMKGSLSRGRYVRGPDEFIPGSDPEAWRAKGTLELMQEASAEAQ